MRLAPAHTLAGTSQLGEAAWDAQGNVTYAYSATPSQATCDTALANLTMHVASYNRTVLGLLANQRLGDLR